MAEQPVKGGPVSRAAAMLCQNPQFRAWLGLRQGLPDISAVTETECANWMRRACGVTSRARLDHETQPRMMFNKIRNEYLNDMRMGELEKQYGYAPFRHNSYLYWVKGLPCVVTGEPAGDVQHVVDRIQCDAGVGDLYVFPLCCEEKSRLGRLGADEWERQHGPQLFYAMRTVERAMSEGVFLVAG